MLIAQLSGIAFALSIAGAIFVNTALGGLQVLLPDIPRELLQSALSGTSGPFFLTLAPGVREQSLAIIMGALQKV